VAALVTNARRDIAEDMEASLCDAFGALAEYDVTNTAVASHPRLDAPAPSR